MEKSEFTRYRKKLNKTQKQMAQLLGTSVKAIHSYEQGWRSIPTHVERQLLFLVSRHGKQSDISKNPCCWTLKKCPEARKNACPAWEFQSGRLCWFINGTICDGNIYKTWKEKMQVCRECEVFKSLMTQWENG